MKTFYIYTNQTKDGNGEITQYIRDYLNLKGCLCRSEVDDKVEGMIVLGGDGTMLRAAREYVSYHIPMIGVNLGRWAIWQRLTERRSNQRSTA